VVGILSLTAALAIYLDSLFQVRVSKLLSMLQPMNVLDKHVEMGKNPGRHRNPCKPCAFESVVLCDVFVINARSKPDQG
jgi:hypothetical protein